MFVSKKYRKDCVFKKFDGDKSSCNFPKTIKMCHTCGCYLKNDGNLDANAKYISLVLGRRTSKIALFISVISLVIAVITLLMKIGEAGTQNNPTPSSATSHDSTKVVPAISQSSLQKQGEYK